MSLQRRGARRAFSPLGDWTLEREGWIGALTGLGAIPAGIIVGLHPVTVLTVVVVAGLFVACFAVPLRYMPALLLAGTLVTPTLVLNGVGGAGQARVVDAVLVLAIVRSFISRQKLAVPSDFPLAVVAAVGLTLGTVVVAFAQPASEVGTNSDLIRDLSFPLAAIIGLLGGADAQANGKRLAIPRSYAALGILGGLACVDYWLWIQVGSQPVTGPLFTQIAHTTAFVGRSVFPFVTDAPNLGAVIFMLLAAFSAPALLLAPGRRDRVLALVLLAATLGAVLATESRTGLVAATAAAVPYVVLVKRAGGRRVTVVATLVILAVLGGYVFSTFPRQRFSGDTLQSRGLIWQQAAKTFLEAPIAGHGYLFSKSGNFVEQAGQSGTTTSKQQSAHSDLLSALVDGGLVGGAIFVGVLALMFRRAARGLRSPDSMPVAVGYFCMLVVLVVGGTDNTTSQSAAIETIEWLTFGVVVGLSSGVRPTRSPQRVLRAR